MHQFALAILDRLRTYLPTLCPLLLAAVLWLPNHPYTGFLNSDAEVYALSALRWLNPAAYAHDPFFMFGSQSDFTIFSSLYGSLIELFGLAPTAKIVMVLAAILWIGAAWGLARCVFDDWLIRTYVVLSMAIYSLNYSPNQATFVLNENYATARVIAIPLTVMAITFSMERKWILAVAMVMLSVVIHPLLGIWGAVIMVSVKLNDRALFALLATMLCAIIAASLAAWPIEFGLMDAQWIEIVRLSTRDVFVGPYGEIRLNATLFWIMALLLGGRFGSPRIRRWYLATALIASWGFLLSQLCSYFYPIQLVIQAQTWRAIWLAVYLGIFALVDIARIFLFGQRQMQAAGVIIAVILVAFPDQSAVFLLLAWLLLHGNLRKIIFSAWSKLSRSYSVHIMVLAVGLMLAILPTYYRELAIEGNGKVVAWLPDVTSLKGLLIFAGLGLGPLVWCGAMVSPTLRAGMTLLLVPALAAAGMHWDQRPEGVLRWENRVSGSSQSQVMKPPVHKGDVVLWPGNSQRVLFEIGTASYVSEIQTTGLILSQKKSTELVRRMARVAISSVADRWPLDRASQMQLLKSFRESHDIDGPFFGNIQKYDAVRLTDSGIAFACEDVALDWIVTGDSPISAIVKFIPIKDTEHEREFYFYDCNRFRSDNALRSEPLSPAENHDQSLRGSI